MEALIVGRTHMGAQACVGAIDVQSGRALRLFHKFWTYPDTHDYLVGQLWDLEVIGRPQNQITPPHVEDVLVSSRSPVGAMTLPEAKAAVLSVVDPWTCALPHVFEGCVVAQNGRPFVSEDAGTPSCSTSFWVADRPFELQIVEGSSDRYMTHQQPFWSMPYVGLDPTPTRIEAGELVRLSLAGWWQGSWAPPGKRCYVQVSGTFG